MIPSDWFSSYMIEDGPLKTIRRISIPVPCKVTKSDGWGHADRSYSTSAKEFASCHLKRSVPMRSWLFRRWWGVIGVQLQLQRTQGRLGWKESKRPVTPEFVAIAARNAVLLAIDSPSGPSNQSCHDPVQ